MSEFLWVYRLGRLEACAGSCHFKNVKDISDQQMSSLRDHCCVPDTEGFVRRRGKSNTRMSCVPLPSAFVGMWTSLA